MRSSYSNFNGHFAVKLGLHLLSYLILWDGYLFPSYGRKPRLTETEAYRDVVNLTPVAYPELRFFRHPNLVFFTKPSGFQTFFSRPSDILWRYVESFVKNFDPPLSNAWLVPPLELVHIWFPQLSLQGCLAHRRLTLQWSRIRSTSKADLASEEPQPWRAAGRSERSKRNSAADTLRQRWWRNHSSSCWSLKRFPSYEWNSLTFSFFNSLKTSSS